MVAPPPFLIREGEGFHLEVQYSSGARAWSRRGRRCQRRRTGGGPGMNGVAPPLFDCKERALLLGESFERQPRCAFHTVRCECGAGTGE